MLGALLLVGLVTAPLSSFALFLPAVGPRRTAGAWASSRRFLTALLGTGVLALAGAGVCYWAGFGRVEAIAAGAAFVVFSLLWLPPTRTWNGRAHVCWTSCVFLYLAYLAFIIDWTFRSGLGVGGTIGGVVLWLLEVVAGVFAGAYLWELCDALGTEDWRRRVTPAVTAEPVSTYQPFVSLHVPAHNEPPEMVIETLVSLTRLDYPNYEIIAIDDNTDDEQLWRPVEAWCQQNGVKFVHLQDWPGYKSGALNYALANMTDPRAEIIGVVDSDYQISPGFLRVCAPLFADPEVGFIQAPQDYRDWHQSSYYRRLYYSYKYFFAVSQPSRNERNAAIFAGTMGLIRRSTLQGLGGWDEWCITEDAELSLRLLNAGWTGLHVDESFGQGVMPLTFEALKGQRYRWCFGGIQILRMHWRRLVHSPRRTGSRLTFGQRWGYLAGGLQWYGDLLGLIFYAFLLAGAVNLATGGGQLFRKLTAFLVAVVPVLIILGLIRAVALLRRGTGASWRDAIGAFFIWQATSLAVARASVQGLFARKAAFLRTPKTFDESSWWSVIRANWGESLLALLGVLGIVSALLHPTTVSGPLLAGLLLVPTLGYAGAPVNSFAAQRAALPPDLARARSTELRRRRVVAGSALAGGGVLVGAAVAAVIALLATPAGHPVRTPQVFGPQHDQNNSAPSSGAPSSGAPSSGAPSSGAPSSGAPSSGASSVAPSGGAPAPSGSTSTATTPASSSSSTTPSSSSSTPTPTSSTPTPTPTTSSVSPSTTP